MNSDGDIARSVSLVGEAWSDSPYYDDAERWTHLFWDQPTVFKQCFDRLDLTNTIELACGFGRHAERMVARAGRLTLIDIFEGNLQKCRARLASYRNVDYVKGDGHDFRPVADRSQSAIFCYDAAVHFSSDIVGAYLKDAARVLEPGGQFLLHHSNYAAPLDRHYGENPHARNHMTTALFATLAADAGLDLVEQKIMPWGGVADIDALSLLRRPD